MKTAPVKAVQKSKVVVDQDVDADISQKIRPMRIGRSI